MLLLAAANAVNLGISVALTFYSLSIESTLAVASIIEAGLLMIIAGGIDFSASIFPSKIRQHVFKSGKEWSSKEHKKAEVSAAKYLLAGVLLLIESFAIGAL